MNLGRRNRPPHKCLLAKRGRNARGGNRHQLRAQRRSGCVIWGRRRATASGTWSNTPPRIMAGSPFPGLVQARHPLAGNQRLESRMRENRPYGSEGGEVKAFPTPIGLARCH